MSGGRMPNCSLSASKEFSSTPIKPSQGKYFHPTRHSADGVLADDEDTFSLLSPIYHDSFDSDEEDLDHSKVQQMSPRQRTNSRLSISPVRCELPKTPSDHMLSPDVHPASTTLNAWKMWMVNKAKEEGLRLEKKAEEERLLKEKREQQDKEQLQKKIVMEEKIQEWLKMKRHQEKQEQLIKQSKEEEEIQKQQEKQKETEQKAQQKYRDWLQKKNREKTEKQKKEKEQLALKEVQEKERREKAEESFKEWLTKSRASPKSPCYTTSPYDKSYPSPSFYNPIPWKPIHVPPPETPVNKTSVRKPQKHRSSQQSPITGLRNTVSLGQLLHKR